MWQIAGSKGAYIATVLFNLIEPTKVFVQRDVAYSVDQQRRADVYKPDTVQGGPIVVFLYGGGWRTGSKEAYGFIGNALARRGFVVVIPEYRHFPSVGLREILDDSAQAVAWSVAHASEFGGDPHRVVVAGHSSGAWATAMLALDPTWLDQAGSEPRAVAGFIGIAGPYSVASLTEQGDKDVFSGSGPEMEPLTHHGCQFRAMLLLAGQSDQDVLPASTSMLTDRLRADGCSVKARLYPHVGHIDILDALNRHSYAWSPVLFDVWKFAVKARAQP